MGMGSCGWVPWAWSNGKRACGMLMVSASIQVWGIGAFKGLLETGSCCDE
jgi:hypothetical protein